LISTRPRDRPLLFLLLFYIVGLSIGPTLIGWARTAFIAALVVAVAAVVWAFIRRKVSLIPLGVALAILGAAHTASVFTPPGSPNHVYQMTGREGLVFGGYLSRPPRFGDDRTRLVIDVREAIHLDGPAGPAIGNIQLTINGRTNLAKGDYVRFPAVLRKITSFGNPGGFDYQRYMSGQGIWVSAFIKHPRLVVPIRSWDAYDFEESKNGWRDRAFEILDQSTSPPVRGLLQAMLLGSNDGMDEDLEASFRRLGLSHLMAVSGLHVGLAALAGFLIARWLLKLWPGIALKTDIRRTSALLAVAPVLLYAALAGGRPSSTRATIMVLVFLLAQLSRRRPDTLTALAAAAWALLIYQGAAVFTASFQLSFVAAGFLILAAHRIIRTERDADTTADTMKSRITITRRLGYILFPAAALVGTMPLVAFHFNRLAWLALPANLVFTPLIALGVIPAGLAALALVPVWPYMSGVIFWLIEKWLWLVLPSVDLMASIPGAEMLASPPGPVFLIAYYGFFLALLIIRPLKKAAPVAVAALVLAVGTVVWPMAQNETTPALEVTVLDVGQGLSVFARLPDQTSLLVDGGGFPYSSFDTGENIVAPFLLDKGVFHLDIVALSHGQADHAGGLPFIFKHFTPKEFWSSRAPVQTAVHRTVLNASDRCGSCRPSLAELHRERFFGPCRVSVLGPPVNFRSNPFGPEPWREPNEYSLVIRLNLGSHSVLLPGDIEALGEANLVNRYGAALHSDVLIAPHHGGKTSLTPGFLKAVSPKVVIFSVGRYNRFNMPHPDVLNRVQEIGADIYRTDRDGAITIKTDGRKLVVTTFR
jgi:competence protein ComEC